MFICGLIVAIVPAATGCGRYSPCSGEGKRPSGLTVQDLAGSYRSDQGSIVTLGENGSLTTTGWPADLDGATGTAERRTGRGNWELSDDPSGWDVSLSFHKISDYKSAGDGHYGSGLEVSGSRQNPQLYYFLGDPDNCDNLIVFKSDP